MTAPARPSFHDWVQGARPRTLPLGVVSVVLGTGVAVAGDPEGPAGYAGRDHHVVVAVLCLVVAVALQVGVNFANDHSDGIRGTDAFRVGPPRLTGSGRAAPGAVLAVALASFAIAAVAGLAVVLLTGLWWMLVVGALSIAAAWGYTGGRRPYGYRALGEVAVFVFFGLVSVLGTELVQIGRVTAEGGAGAVALGLFACGVLMVNNIRDIDVDREAGKRTLAVVVGRRTARILYALFMLLPYAVLVFTVLHAPLTLVALASLAPAIWAVRIGTTAATPRPLIRALQLSSAASLLFGVLLAVALVVDAVV